MWESVWALKNGNTAINAIYETDVPEKLSALRDWLVRYNSFVERWTKEFVPDDIDDARVDISAHLQLHGLTLPE